jgi:hypothetical protein
MGQGAQAREIHMRIEAGETQSLELFDFNSQDNRVVTNDLIKDNTFLCHDGDNLVYDQNYDFNKLLYTVKVDHHMIELVTSMENDKCLWRVLKAGEMYPLDHGTYIKLGKVKLRLKEVVEEEKEMTERDMKSNSQHFDLLEVKSVSEKSQHSKQSSNQERVCRICFESTCENGNPLVSLCKCMGTVKYIHFECLRDWISKNVVRREQNNTLFYSYEEPKCELCRKYYQAEFTYNGKKYSLLDMDHAPNPPYAVFEGIDFEDEARRYSVLLIGLGDDEISIGRNSNSNVVMKEISVSRNHCSLLYKNKHLFIKDKGSKFGTLIRLDGEVEFSPNQGISLQYESKLLTIKEKTQLNCCCAESDTFLLKVKRNGMSSDYFDDPL